ncbi:FAD-binding oxidoreductase [Affinibrenneria salicis]|uniref:FAD-binding oxidoreductase n=1 Tax=Affinibrenneria salicis TaxID=2590031 RepID=A0A5J5G322_9GAMM|nr:FAD-dependent oxidoreductase [Affinibrenneria salicis]KAA9001307.1 FAD-binding oxidoreductase [Affinibrenneria salicis]
MTMNPTEAIRKSDLLIIGGGIHGCCTALFAALRGMSVVVLEKDSVARHASGVNAGGVRRLQRHIAELPLSNMSMDLWYDINNLLDDDCEFKVAPQIEVAENEQEMVGLRARSARLLALGYDNEVILERNELKSILPAISDHAVGGLASLKDGFTQPYKTTLAFKRKAESLGVRFFEGVAARQPVRKNGVWQVSTQAGSFYAPKLLNAAGAWGGDLSASLGEPVPIEALAPMMMVTTRLPPFCHAVVMAAKRPLSFKQMPNGTVVIGGGRLGRADRHTNLSEVVFSNLQPTAETAIDLFPIMRNATLVRSWSGVEGWLPDSIPVIGASAKHEDLYHSFAFCTHGFQMGPGVGKVMAELIASGSTTYDLSPFSVARFTPVMSR